MLKELKPKVILKEISRSFPQAWEQVKRFRAGKGKDLPDWPDWCYIPLAAGVAIATQGDDDQLFRASFNTRLNPAVITAAASWRVSQGIYRFDADLYNSLINQPLDDNIPCELLKRLPEYCVYIETINTNFLSEPIEGFWAHLEYDVNNGETELRLLIITDDFYTPIAIHLGDWTIEEGLRKMQDEAVNQSSIHGLDFNKMLDAAGTSVVIDSMVKDVTPLVQLVLYLCADNADMSNTPVHPRNRVRMSGQIDVPKEPKVWNVGVRIGTAIRRYRNENLLADTNETEYSGTHASPRPHIRRAHFHHFWAGPKQGERYLILKWLPPIPVNVDDDILPAVIHRVK